MKGHAHHAQHSLLKIKDKPVVLEHRLHQSQLPAPALTCQHGIGFWAFGPTYRIRGEDHLRLRSGLLQEGVQAGDDVNVFRDGVTSEAARLNHRRPVQKTKRARGNEVAL